MTPTAYAWLNEQAPHTCRRRWSHRLWCTHPTWPVRYHAVQATPQV